jgi:cell division protein FtsI (penicillin-binding protein 3)
LLWGFLIVCRLISLQIVHHDDYTRQAQQQQDRDVEIQAPRGVIFDRTGQRLAMSLPVDSVCVNPLRIPDLALASDLLSKTLSMDGDELLGRLVTAADNRRGFLWIKRKITPEESKKLRSYNLDWIEFRTESRRFYPKGWLTAHVLGGVDHEEKGNAGIERSLNSELEGKAGSMRTTSDVKQRVMEQQVFSEPQPGKNITLSIDERIQYVAETELKEAVIGNHCKTGSLVAMNPYTGEVYAMAAYPNYDPNTSPNAKDEMDDRTNLAVSSPFEPGSMFKVITLSAALESTHLRPDTIIPCGNGRMTLFKRVIHDHNSYASLSMTDVLAKSSNIGAIWIGLRVGDARMYEYVRRFGFGSATGIPLPGESGGLVRKLSRWIPSSIGSVAMGHQLMATTLQMAQACSVIANGGTLIRPRLLLKRQVPGKDVEDIQAPQTLVRVVKPETAFTMGQMMKHVVMRGGTGFPMAKLDGYSVAGKTGSAQIYDFKARVYTHKYNASFMGFAPVSNPAIVIVVTLNGASKYGGAVAAPVFRKVATAALRILGIPKDLPEGVQEVDDGNSPVDDLSIADLGSGNPLDDDETVVASTGSAVAAKAAAPEASNAGTSDGQQSPADGSSTVAEAQAKPPEAQLVMGPKVPNLHGKTLRAVLEETSAMGVQVEYSGSGLARVQQPPPGTPLRRGERIRVEFAR